MATILAASLCLLLSPPVVAADQKAASPFRVAIVGAGVGGASAAFHLHDRADPNVGSTAVTIFESGPVAGGRLKVAYPPEYEGNPNYAFETGAPWIFETDSCIRLAANRTASSLHRVFHDAALWSDGMFVEGAVCHHEELRSVVDDARRYVRGLAWSQLNPFTYPVESRTIIGNFFDLLGRLVATAKFYWIHGSSMRALENELVRIRQRWDEFGSSSQFFNLKQEVERVGLVAPLRQPAWDYLLALGISPGFLLTFVEPCARALFGQELIDISGMAGVLSAQRRAYTIGGGNVHLVERLIASSGAELRLNSRVIGAEQATEGRYRLTIATEDSIQEAFFDSVIIAAPLDQEGMEQLVAPSAPGGKFRSPPAYVDTHTTLASAIFSPAIRFFVGSSSAHRSVPGNLVVAKSASRDILGLSPWAGTVRYHGRCNYFECDQGENILRIQTRQDLDDDSLLGLFDKRNSRELERGAGKMPGFGWISRQAWPRAFPRYDQLRGLPTQDIEVAPNLFYLGAGEEVLSMMEMSCRMGRNAAGLVRLHRLEEADFAASISTPLAFITNNSERDEL